MTRLQRLVFGLNAFGRGLLLPILSLFLLAHGCSLQTLPLAMGVYAATVVLAEVPSGIFADRFGCKKAFLWACALMPCALALLYTGHPILGMVPFGLNAAFQSGSLDSLMMEDCLRRGCDDARVSSTMLVWQCGGIAAGSVTSSLLPNIAGYGLHVAVRVGVLLAAALLCGFGLNESKRPKHRPLRLSVLSRRPFVPVCVFGIGLSVFAAETYWQPQFVELSGAASTTGLLCAAGFGCSMFGSFLGGRSRACSSVGLWKRYRLFAALSGLSVCAMGLCHSALAFAGCYLTSQTLLGLSAVPEQTLLNRMADSGNRASLLSVASLCARMAGMVGSPLCAQLVTATGITGVLLAFGGLTVCVSLATSFAPAYRGCASEE